MRRGHHQVDGVAQGGLLFLSEGTVRQERLPRRTRVYERAGTKHSVSRARADSSVVTEAVVNAATLRAECILVPRRGDRDRERRGETEKEEKRRRDRERETRQDETREDETRQEKMQEKRQDKTREDGRGETRQEKMKERREKTRREKMKEERQDKTREDERGEREKMKDKIERDGDERKDDFLRKNVSESARRISPKCFEKNPFRTNYSSIFPLKVQNLTVFSINYVIRIRFFGPGELLQNGFGGCNCNVCVLSLFPLWSVDG